MEYNTRSLTRSGAAMFANADANKQPLILDKLVVSDKVIPAGTDVSQIKLSDFTNSKQFDINNVSQTDNSFTATSVITNTGLTADLSLALIGVLAHVGGDTDNQDVIAVAIGNDPFVLPKDTGTPFRFVPAITIGYSASQNVTLQVNDDVYVTQADLADLMKQQGYATTKYVDDAVKDIPKPDMSKYQTPILTKSDGTAKVVIASGNNVDDKLKALIGANDEGSISIDIGATNNTAGHTLYGWYANLASGIVNITAHTSDNVQWLIMNDGTTTTWKQVPNADDVDSKIATAKQGAIDQADTDTDAKLAKLPQFWNGTQAEFDAITTKDPNTYYYIYDDDAS